MEMLPEKLCNFVLLKAFLDYDNLSFLIGLKNVYKLSWN